MKSLTKSKAASQQARYERTAMHNKETARSMQNNKKLLLPYGMEFGSRLQENSGSCGVSLQTGNV